MSLRFDPVRRCYIGSRLVVSAELFEDAVTDLALARGEPEPPVRSLLLDERHWVRRAYAGPVSLCLSCCALLRRGRRYCSVLCEAEVLARRLVESLP